MSRISNVKIINAKSIQCDNECKHELDNNVNILAEIECDYDGYQAYLCVDCFVKAVNSERELERNKNG